jgi:hypothetical protein
MEPREKHRNVVTVGRRCRATWFILSKSIGCAFPVADRFRMSIQFSGFGPDGVRGGRHSIAAQTPVHLR